MKLTDYILMKELLKSCRLYDENGEDAGRLLQAAQPGDESIFINGILLFEPGMEVEDGWCYLAAEEDKAQLRTCFKNHRCVLLLPAPENSEAVNGPGDEKQEIPFMPRPGIPGCRIIFAEGDTAGILNSVYRLFQSFEADRESLLTGDAGAAGPDEVLMMLQEKTGNPVVLLRDDLSVCSQAVPAAESRAAHWPLELVNALLQDSSYEENMKNTGVYWGPEDILEYRTLNRNISLPDGRQFILSMEEQGRLLDKADADLLALLAGLLQSVLQEAEGRSGYREGALHRALRSLVCDEEPDFADAARALTGAEWQREHQFFCLVLETIYTDRRKMPSRAVCLYLQQMSDCCAFSVGERVVCFFNLSRSGRSAHDISSALTPFIRDSLLRAGYSRTRDGYALLPQLYQQASAALELGSGKQPYTWIHYFDRVGLDYLLEKMNSGMDAELICHPALLRLQQSDRENGTLYMETLRTYLRNHLNAVHSAKELYIHRSTFLYRMEKIREMIGDILDDPDEVLYLLLSFCLLDKGS